MDSITQWLIVIAVVITSGWFAAMITQVLKRPTWPSWLKLTLAIVVSGIVGVAAVWLSGGLTTFIANWKHLSAGQVLAVGSLVYASAALWFHKVYGATTWFKALAFWPGKAPTAYATGGVLTTGVPTKPSTRR